VKLKLVAGLVAALTVPLASAPGSTTATPAQSAPVQAGATPRSTSSGEPPTAEPSANQRPHPRPDGTIEPRETWTKTRDGRPLFVDSGARFRNAVWLGTFNEGLYRVSLDAGGHLGAHVGSRARPVASPVRMVNRLVATDRALFVGANEGLFVTRDGATFRRLETIAARAITGLATTKEHLWVASTEAVYRIGRAGLGRVERAIVYPAGSHAIQSLEVDQDGVAWIATEDRGIVRIDEQDVRAADRLAGLPTSWFVDVEPDGAGGAFGASLRHGAVHLERDGSWELVDWAPDAWTLGVRVAGGGHLVCVGTQDGAACRTRGGGGRTLGLAGLPDARAHFFLPVGDTMLVGTEAGIAVYGEPEDASGS
jgi:ligand-binding sensor domain-containing protein